MNSIFHVSIEVIITSTLTQDNNFPLYSVPYLRVYTIIGGYQFPPNEVAPIRD